MEIFTPERVWIDDKFDFYGDWKTVLKVNDIIELYTEKNYKYVTYGSAKILSVNTKENMYLAIRIA